jgi:hypothetical protein
MRTVAARRGSGIMAVMLERPWWRGGWAYSAAAKLGVDSEALAAANRGRPPAPARLLSQSALLGLGAGVGTYSIMSLVVSGMLAVPYYLLGRPDALIWISWLLVVLMLAFAWHVGSLTRRLWLIRTLRREGPQATDR